MLTKFQAPIPGEQPSIAAGGLATMQLPFGPRIGVIYAELTVIKAAGGAGVISLPLLTDVADPVLPTFVKVGGKPLRQRLATELINDNLLQDTLAGGSVAYYQGGVLIARVTNANNASSVGLGLAANTATTAVFQVPHYFAEYWRKDVNAGEGLAFPTNFVGGLTSKPLTVEVPIANNGGGAFSAWACKFWYDYDGLQFPVQLNGDPTAVVLKKGRFTKAYSVAGDLTFALPQKEGLAQFSIRLAAGDKWSRIIIRKNGTTLKDITPDQLSQMLQDHGMNVAAFLPNQVHVIFDLNDDLNADPDNCEARSFRKALKDIEPLPNLDFKIRCANSLVDYIHGEPVELGRLAAEKGAALPLSKLNAAKRDFFIARTAAAKRKLRLDIYDAITDLARLEFTRARMDTAGLGDAMALDDDQLRRVTELDNGLKEIAFIAAQLRAARKMRAQEQEDALERIRARFDDPEKPTFIWQIDFAEVFHRDASPSPGE